MSSPSSHHAAHSFLDDRCDLVCEGGVVRHDGRERSREEQRVAVLVLQALSVQGGAARSGTEKEPAPSLVTVRPDHVADTLEPEHRIEDEERDHRLAVGCVRRPRRGERSHRAGLGDALLEDLTLLATPCRREGARRLPVRTVARAPHRS